MPHIHLEVSDLDAALVDDLDWGGTILTIGGHEQSHVNPADPREIRYEYLRRIANVLDEGFEAGAPITILHLGAGALTLARYVQATRPGSIQLAVDIEPRLVTFVLENLPLPAGTRLEHRVGDALAQVRALSQDHAVSASTSSGEVRRFHAAVLDVFSGKETAPHLATATFYGAALDVLDAEAEDPGVLLVNIGDDEPQRFLDAQARELHAACAERDYPEPWILTDAHVAHSRATGNSILVAGPLTAREDFLQIASRVRALGPHPAVVEPWRDVLGA